MLVTDSEKVREVIFLPGTWKGFETASAYAAWNFLKNCKCTREIRGKQKRIEPKFLEDEKHTLRTSVSLTSKSEVTMMNFTFVLVK